MESFAGEAEAVTASLAKSLDRTEAESKDLVRTFAADPAKLEPHAVLAVVGRLARALEKADRDNERQDKADADAAAREKKAQANANKTAGAGVGGAEQKQSGRQDSKAASAGTRESSTNKESDRRTGKKDRDIFAAFNAFQSGNTNDIVEQVRSLG